MIYRGLVVSGTDTGVGKTEVACALLRGFRETGQRVIGIKPVETGCRSEGGELIPADGLRLREAAGADEPLERRPKDVEGRDQPGRDADLDRQRQRSLLASSSSGSRSPR